MSETKPNIIEIANELEAEIQELHEQIKVKQEIYLKFCFKHKLNRGENVSPKMFIELAAKVFGTDYDKIVEKSNKSRKGNIIKARHISAFFIYVHFNQNRIELFQEKIAIRTKKLPGFVSLKAIGKLIGGKDHSTINYIIEKFESVIELPTRNMELFEDMEKMRQAIKDEFRLFV